MIAAAHTDVLCCTVSQLDPDLDARLALAVAEVISLWCRYVPANNPSIMPDAGTTGCSTNTGIRIAGPSRGKRVSSPALYRAVCVIQPALYRQ